MSNEIIAAFVGMVFTVGISLGFSKAASKRQEKDIEDLKQADKDLDAKLNSGFVSFNHFNEAIGSLREMQRDMREDLKKILDLITSKRKRS